PPWQSSKGTRGVEGGGGIPWETPQRSKFRVPFVVDAQVLQHRGHDAFVVVEAADVEVALAILRDDEVADGCVGELALTGGEGVPAAQQELALLPEGARAFEIHELAHAVLLEEPAHVRLDLPAQLAPLGDGLGDQLVEALPELRRDPLQRQGSAYAGRRRRGRCGDGWRGGGRRRGGLGRDGLGVRGRRGDGLGVRGRRGDGLGRGRRCIRGGRSDGRRRGGLGRDGLGVRGRRGDGLGRGRRCIRGRRGGGPRRGGRRRGGGGAL